MAIGSNAIRGSRVGAGPMGEAERGEAAPRFYVSYWCANGHVTRPSFAQETQDEVPEEWDCPRCGFPAGQDKENPPAPARNERYKTHLAYVKERRSDKDGEAILQEALANLRARRGGKLRALCPTLAAQRLALIRPAPRSYRASTLCGAFCPLGARFAPHRPRQPHVEPLCGDFSSHTAN